MPFVAAETVLVAALAAAFPSPGVARVVTETPANLASSLPCIQVTRFGGGDSGYVLDQANVDVDTYAVTRDDSRMLAEQVRAFMLTQLPGQTVAGASVAEVRTISAPTWTPYDDTSLRRFTASYQVTLHSTL